MRTNNLDIVEEHRYFSKVIDDIHKRLYQLHRDIEELKQFKDMFKCSEKRPDKWCQTKT